ncbi:peptidylprolyl isomerase [Liberibacter crescens]|nr:peptidylprolyl isomerase [Liberibacter crescens]
MNKLSWREKVIFLSLFLTMMPLDKTWTSEIRKVRITVNDTVITNGDVSRRAALLKLFKKSGNLKKIAEDELIIDGLKQQEIDRFHMSPSDAQINNVFKSFAESNKLSVKQMKEILDHVGVGEKHFKNFLSIQMAWPYVVSVHSEQNTDTPITGNKKPNPTTTEYILQQIIFIIPQSFSASKRNVMIKKRKKEAEASRSKFPGCEKAKEFASKMRDVYVSDSQRLLEPMLSPEFKKLLNKIKNGTTPTHVTEKGIEYISICSQRQVNDDTASLVISKATDFNKKQQKNSEQYIADLRSKARIRYY